MRQLVDTEEANSIAECGFRNAELIKMPARQAAEHFRVSVRTIERWVFAGKIKGEFVNTGKGYGKGGLILFVFIDKERPLASVGDPPHRPAEDGDHNKAGGEGMSNSSEFGVRSSELENQKIENKRNKVHRGEPGCRVVTELVNGEPVLNKGLPVISDQLSVISDKIKNLPAIIERPLPARSNKIANLRFALIEAPNKDLAREHPQTLPLFKNGNGKPSRTKSIQKFLDLYNSGILLPDIHSELGSISRSTLYNWLQLYDQGGVDGLAPQYRGAQATPIAPAEKQFLRTKLLDQNKPTIGDSINKCKFLLGEASPSSPAKLRRWVNDFRKNNYDIWTLEREGQKALNDKCVPYAEREWRDLQVGEAVVADGHKLNFQVINPFTGKPCRAMMVLFWDWKSAFPLGWEIMLTESIQCVVSALRNAIITLGKFPKHALLDNSKAFRASIFVKKFRFEETEIPGIFDRLNIQPHFAMPYNAQSKPIERFFRTFNDWFEREMPSYTGASINDKPAHMHRNEKRALALHNDWVPTIPEAMELVFKWREYYIAQPLRARDGQRPYDIFNAEKGPGVDPFALHFLMMAAKARMVHRNGITFNGWHWYHEELYGFKDWVLMFYSYYDLSQVYIFEMTSNGSPGKFKCVAKPIEKLKPFASEEFPEDMAAVKRNTSTKRKLIRTTKNFADMLQSEKQVYIDWNRELRDRPEVAGAIRQIKNKEGPKLISLSTQEEIENYEVKINESAGNTGEGKFYERYDQLTKRGTLTDSEKEWIQQYRTGKIAPGEYKTIYGGHDASQIHSNEECQEVCLGG